MSLYLKLSLFFFIMEATHFHCLIHPKSITRRVGNIKVPSYISVVPPMPLLRVSPLNNPHIIPYSMHI